MGQHSESEGSSSVRAVGNEPHRFFCFTYQYTIPNLFWARKDGAVCNTKANRGVARTTFGVLTRLRCCTPGGTGLSLVRSAKHQEGGGEEALGRRTPTRSVSGALADLLAGRGPS